MTLRAATDLAVLIMAKAPHPGRVKTRLQPLLGPLGCARLQAALLQHTVELARRAAPGACYLAVDGRWPEQPKWPGVTVLRQRGADLGQRMAAAVAAVDADHGGPIVVIGTDVPGLTGARLSECADRLAGGHDVVFGPALDGGYYLVGLRQPRPEAFAIDPALWGGPGVLAASLVAVRRAGLRCALLPMLRDLDTPDDAAALLREGSLPAGLSALLRDGCDGVARTGGTRCNADAASVSIVVPTLNEAATIAATVRRLRADFPGCDIVVVDGGSDDGTADRAAPLAQVITAPRGRGAQLNAGAAATTGEVLWFLHADTQVAPDALRQLRMALTDPEIVGGGLSLRFDRRSPTLNALARLSNVRARRLHLIFGDQAMFVRRSVFDRLGGFPPIVLMEDLEFSRRLHRAGRLALLPATSTASARRFTEHGTVRMVAFMQYLKILYLAGVPPESLRRRYERGPLPRRHRPRGSTGAAGHRPSIPDPHCREDAAVASTVD